MDIDLRARDLMTTDVETVNADEDVSEVLTKLARRDFTGFPVVNEADGLVGVVTQRDLVHLFQPSDRTLWIPIGLPPFLETVEYAIDLSWDELDTELDLLKHTNKPVSSIMTTDVVTVSPDATFDEIVDILGNEDRDINRIPVVEEGALVGIITRQDVLRALREQSD